MKNFTPLLKLLRFNLDAFSAFWLSIVLLTNFPLFYDFYNGTTHAPKYYIFTLALALLYFVLAPLKSLKFAKEPFVIWCILLLFVVVANYVRLVSGEYKFQFSDIEFDKIERIIILPALAFICWSSDPRMFWKLLPISCIIIACSNIFDLAFPGDLGPINDELGSGRADGFYLNANPAAEAALLSVFLIRNHCPKAMFIVLYTIVGLGVMATFSRSGMAMWFLLGAFMSFSGKLPKLFLSIPLIALFSINIFIEQIEDGLRSIPEYQYSADNMISRLTFFTDSVDGESYDQLSDDSRGEIALAALEEAFEKPFFGFGYDYEDPIDLVGPHNQIISLFHVYGLAGIALWIGLVYCLWRGERHNSGYLYAITFMFVWFSLFSHNLLENVFWFVAIAIGLFSETSTSRFDRFDDEDRLYVYGNKIRSKRKRRKRRKRSVK